MSTIGRDLERNTFIVSGTIEYVARDPRSQQWYEAMMSIRPSGPYRTRWESTFRHYIAASHGGNLNPGILPSVEWVKDEAIRNIMGSRVASGTVRVPVMTYPGDQTSLAVYKKLNGGKLSGGFTLPIGIKGTRGQANWFFPVVMMLGPKVAEGKIPTYVGHGVTRRHELVHAITPDIITGATAAESVAFAELIARVGMFATDYLRSQLLAFNPIELRESLSAAGTSLSPETLQQIIGLLVAESVKRRDNAAIARELMTHQGEAYQKVRSLLPFKLRLMETVSIAQGPVEPPPKLDAGASLPREPLIRITGQESMGGPLGRLMRRLRGKRP